MLDGQSPGVFMKEPEARKRPDVSMATPSPEEVTSRLQRYDVRSNKELAALFPSRQYPHTRRCAVLLPLFYHPVQRSLHVLLTVRAANLRSHAGNVALPGGAADATDWDDVHTALREAHEEVGLSPDDVTVVTALPPFFARDRNSVFPIVGFIPSQFRPTPSPCEVALVFSVPLTFFVESMVTYHSYSVNGFTVRYPFLNFVHNGTPILIWGVTCTICMVTARAILGPYKRLRLVFSQEELKRKPLQREGRSAQQAERSLEQEGRSLQQETNSVRQEGRLLQQEGSAQPEGRPSQTAGTESGWSDDIPDVDDNVFGDIVIVYHMLCRRLRPQTSHL